MFRPPAMTRSARNPVMSEGTAASVYIAAGVTRVSTVD